MKRILTASSLLVCCLIAGCGTPSLLITPVANTSQLDEVTVQPGHAFGGKIAIIQLDGMLIDEKSGGILQPEENPLSLFVQQLNMAADDDSVKAIVLRVNSPGGTVTSADIMYQSLLRFKQKTHKPVIASTQEICASGAYYVSCASDEIVAEPTGLVGSIGVIFETFDVSGGLNKIGVRSETVKDSEGKYKDMASPFKPMTDDERKIIQDMVDADFARFKDVVTTNRHLTDVAEATTGRVFSGTEGLRLGLVDQVGLLDDAIDLAKQKANAQGASVVMYKRPYGYEGSIYADSNMPPPKADGVNLSLLNASAMLPTGFYYLWQP